MNYEYFLIESYIDYQFKKHGVERFNSKLITLVFDLESEEADLAFDSLVAEGKLEPLFSISCEKGHCPMAVISDLTFVNWSKLECAFCEEHKEFGEVLIEMEYIIPRRRKV